MRISDWSSDGSSSDHGDVLERDADFAEAVVDDHDVLGALLAGLLVRPALGALEAVDEDRVAGSAAVVYVGGGGAEDLDVVGGGLVVDPLPLVVLRAPVDQDPAADERLVLAGVEQLGSLGQVAGEIGRAHV